MRRLKRFLALMCIAFFLVGFAARVERALETRLHAQSSGGGGGGGWGDGPEAGCDEGALYDCMAWLLFGWGDESACWLCSGGG